VDRAHGRAITAMVFQMDLQKDQIVTIVDMKFESHNAIIKIATVSIITSAKGLYAANSIEEADKYIDKIKQALIRVNTSADFLRDRM
jgi:hypothetical protein